VSNSNKVFDKGYVKKISGEIPLESIEFQCETVGLIIYSEKNHVEYIYPLLLQIETVLKEQGICPKRLGVNIRSSEDYLETLENIVDDCALILIILDGFRPNVLFEFGYVVAKRKPLIILKSKDAKINIKTLYRNAKDSGITPRNFGILRNPTIEVPFHLSDFAGKHISKIDWKAKDTDPFYPPTVLKKELLKKKIEIIQETTRIKTKELPPTVPMEVLELIIEVFGYYYSKEKVSIEKVEKLYSNLEGLAKTHGIKPPIKIYDMLSSIYIRQLGDTLGYSDNVSYLIAAQKINNNLLGLLSAKENFRARILMRNGEISQRLLFYTSENEHGYAAIKAFEEAIEIFSSGQMKRDIASAQSRIGETYSIMADIENTAINCEKAIKSYIKALKIFTREEFLYEYVHTQYKLGSAYYKLSEVKNRIDNLKKSIEEIDKLRKMGKLRLAILGYYGDIQNLLGLLHSNLAEDSDNREDYKKAFDFYQEALGTCSVQKNPLGYAIVQNNRGVYYARMADIEKDANLKKENIKKAIDSFTKALEVYTYEKFPREYFDTKSNLCEVYRRLAKVENKVINCKKAIENCEQALRIQHPKPYPKDYARAQLNLGASYATLAEVENPLDNFKKSIQSYNEILKLITPKSDATFYASTQRNIGDVYQNIFKIDKQKMSCKKASRAYKTALKIYRSLGYTKDITEIREKLENLSDFSEK